MRRVLAEVLVVVAGAALSGSAWASEPSLRLEDGMRVRLTAPPSVHLAGLADIRDGQIDLHAGRILARDRRRILIEAPDGSALYVPQPKTRVEGRLIAQADDGFLVEIKRGADPVRVPRAAVAAVEVGGGRSSRGAHVLAGLLVGAAVGAGVGAITGTGCGPSDWFCSPGFNAAAFAILGAPVGAVAGAAWPVERWKPAGRTALRLDVLPARRGAGLAVALSF